MTSHHRDSQASRAAAVALAGHRAGRGWSQAQLAERAGISRAEVSGIETGRLSPSVTVALRLAAALGATVEALFGARREGADWSLAWASDRSERRLWRAQVGGRLLAYPVEATAIGLIPHDATLDESGHRLVEVSEQHAERTLVIAGCDPLAGLIVEEVAAQHGIRVLPLLRSSSEALAMLQQGLVHAAGIHLTTRTGESDNDRVVRDRLGARHTLIHQVSWDSGIALSPRRRERSVRAVLRAGLRWVNREEGSAARLTLDRLLARQARPAGYDRVVGDHRAVAATVSSGWAEAGLCVRPAAAEAKLSFVPVERQSYELCVADATLGDPRVGALIASLRSVRYRRWLADVPGCATGRTGEQRAVA